MYPSLGANHLTKHKKNGGQTNLRQNPMEIEKPPEISLETERRGTEGKKKRRESGKPSPERSILVMA